MHDRPISVRLQTPQPSSPAGADTQAARTRGEQGYAMAVLLVALAVMLTLMTVAMPVWRQQQQREREEELLFRLKQYAHALVLYQRRMPGASPPTIDQLVEQKYLRKKYKDPITGKDFAVLRVGQVSVGMTSPVPGLPAPGPQQGSGRATSPGQGTPTGRAPSTFGQGRAGPGGATGGIRGVVSTSKERSLRIWKGRQQYDQWEVTMEDLTPRSFGPNVQPDQNRRPGFPGAGNPRPTGPRGGMSPRPGVTPVSR